ncbi:MAG: VanZ family protein, partial [Oscillospiraceae bacterium]
MNTKNKKSIRIFIITFSWILVIALMWIIFSFSNQEATVSSGTSSSVIAKIFELFHIRLSQGMVRKTAHMLEYFALFTLLYNAYYQTFRKPQPLLSILSVAFLASSDEIHQYFVAGRACMLRDVFVDIIGGLFALVICTLI